MTAHSILVARTLADVVNDAQKRQRMTDDSIVTASRQHESGGFSRQTLYSIKRGRAARPETFEALMYALNLEPNEIRAELGWPQREVHEPFIHNVPFLDQLNRHYRNQLVRMGYEFYKAQRWSEQQRSDDGDGSER